MIRLVRWKGASGLGPPGHAGRPTLSRGPEFLGSKRRYGSDTPSSSESSRRRIRAESQAGQIRVPFIPERENCASSCMMCLRFEGLSSRGTVGRDCGGLPGDGWFRPSLEGMFRVFLSSRRSTSLYSFSCERCILRNITRNQRLTPDRTCVEMF